MEGVVSLTVNKEEEKEKVAGVVVGVGSRVEKGKGYLGKRWREWK